MSGCSTDKIPQQSELEVPVATEETVLTDANKEQTYLNNVDVNYSYKIAEKLTEFGNNPKLGYRNAGSEAEKQAGEMLYKEMQEIGLVEVTRDAFKVDGWSFEKADLVLKTADGKETTMVLGGYPTHIDTEGAKEFPLVYAGKGTAKELDSLDVKGKVVLVDINQRKEWWINYPALEAHNRGAVAVIAAQEGGYGELSNETLNSQDACGPKEAVAFSISNKDADVIKKEIENSSNSEIIVSLDAKSIVEENSESANIVGKIIGKNPEQYIILSAHYDAYFKGFQDDSVAIGMMLGIAKGLVDSQYQPDKTIIFVAQGAEEWGVTNSRYDWSTGAYNQIFNLHPEWVSKAIVDINFEHPAYEHASMDEIKTTYEYSKFLEQFITKVPKVEDVYKDGIAVSYPLVTWSDDYSYSLAGVPAMRNYYHANEFMKQMYHSQMDTKETYNEKALLFHQNMYGLLVMEYDNLLVLPMDFTVRLEALSSVIQNEIFTEKADSLLENIEELQSSANEINAKAADLNDKYKLAKQANNSQDIAALQAEATELNKALLSTYKYMQDTFVRLTWEDEEIFPHEHFANNISNLSSAVKSLQNGNNEEVLDSLLSVDNNWYADGFSKSTFDYFTDYAVNQPKEKLTWGYERIMGHINLYDIIASVKSKNAAQSTSYEKEIEFLQECLDNETKLYEDELGVLKVSLENLKTQFNVVLKK